MGDLQVPVASAEDIVTMKILAGRAKDRDDVAAILGARPVDAARVRSTLRLLEGALARGGLVAEFERLLEAGRRPLPPA